MNGFKFTGDRYGFQECLRKIREGEVEAKKKPEDRAPVPAGAIRESSLTRAGRIHFLGDYR